MKDKRGFTLVELLGVIVVLALVMVLLMPAITGTSDSARKKAYETKMDLIEDSAVTYAQDNYRKIIDNANKGTIGYSTETENGVTYRIQTIKVKDLIPDYLVADNENDTNRVTDPRTSGSYLDDYDIVIKINPNTRKVTAKVTNR